MRTLFALASLTLLPCALKAQDDPVQQVMAVRAGIGPAMRAGDTAALEKIWSPEMKVNSPGNTILDRAAVLSLLRAGQIKYSAFSDTLESSSVSGDLVILMGHEELTEAVGPDAGKPKVRRYTDVWKRNPQGAWMLIARQATYIASPPPVQAQAGLVSCKPLSQKTGETGCWILGSETLGTLSDPIFWTIDAFSRKEQAEAAKGPHGTVVTSLGKIWLLTVGEKLGPSTDGERVGEIGPLPIHPGQPYTAQFMEATLNPGMVSRTHLHSGIEVFFTDSGETCLETPAGKQISRKGTPIIVDEGVPMELTATGSEIRRGMMLILHSTSMPPTTLVESWKAKGLCNRPSHAEDASTSPQPIRP